MRHASVLELFERSADEHEHRAAIDRAGRVVTYGELDIASSNLANYLLGAGAEKGEAVAILAEDPAAAVTAILGALKAGGVFVPLDAATPEKRLLSMLALVRPRWYVVEEKFLGLVEHLDPGSDEGGRVICLGREARAGADGGRAGFAAHFNPRRPGLRPAPDDTCYVYFTSGSTGQPKGILGRMKGIDHFIRWETRTLSVGAGTRVSQLLPFSFDGSLRDIFVPLTAGGTICVPPDRETVLDARRLAAWLDSERVEIVHCVPSLFRSVVNQPLSAEMFPALKYILMAGEALLPSDVKRWVEVFGDRVQLVNLYGTSETTMAKFIYFVKPSDHERRSIPIGQPMEGAAALVVDAKGRPCPRGAVGEIYIRTPYRTHGYCNQPELTREVFIPNPFSDDPNDIVYKTGDLGRVLEDGNYEYLGRQDRQVKVRGVRVELDEIESALRSHAAVMDLAVIDREDAAGYSYLCAYVVLGGDADAAQLRDHCAAQLPDYMVPSAFVVMSELPRTISGKVDRRALPEPGAGTERPYRAPETPVEELLCGVFAEVLGLRRVGADDNFFHLGGHSLSATRVVSRVRAAAGAGVSLRDLFEAPTPSLLARRVGRAESEGAGAEVAAPPLVARAREEGGALPLSFAQQRLWFFEQLEPGSSAYNMPMAVRMEGELGVDALARSLAAVVSRHEALRTTFSPSAEGVPVQIVHPPPARWPLPLTDLGHLPPGEREGEVRRLVSEEAARPFDLESGPLLRTELLRLGEAEHVLLLTMHHIVSDGWSMGVLVKEAVAFYEAYSEGREAALAELPIQYADYAVWQREALTGDALQAQLDYWRGRLSGAPPALELPTDHARPAVVSYRGGREGFEVSAEVTRGLRELSRREGATLFMTLLAAFKTLLSRYTEQEDIVVGTPVAGRNRVEVEPLVGFFVNTLVLRTNLGGAPRFRELLGKVKEAALGAYAHQDLPFEKLVEELQPERSLSHHPLFQVMFTMQNAPFDPVELPRLKLTALGDQSVPARFDLNIHATETEQGIVGQLFYNADLFDAATIRRFLDHFGRLLEGVVRAPDERVALLPLMGEAERRKLLVEWNDERGDYQLEKCIHELFEEQVARTPEADALIFEGQRLSYDELNRRANQLAHYLRRQGVGAEAAVGLHLERSAELVIAVLGILKAGAGYVALDPEYPPERKAFMLDDALVSIVLTQESAADGLPAHRAPVVDLAAESEAIAAESEANPAPAAAPDNLAYVIYTSGSTGRPKGVAGSHRQLLSYIYGISERLRFTPGASFAMQQTPSVDAPITYLFGALCAGGTLHVISRERAFNARALGDYLRRHRIDYFKAAPSYFAALQSSPQPERLMPRRLLLIGGEASRSDWVAGVQALAPGCAVVNHYGPTETTVGVLTYEAPPGADAKETVILPLGRPLPNAEIYLLDSHLNPVPIGVPGELYIGGPSLARGYVNRADLTAEKFIPHPFTVRPGARLYRTGDLARYLPDGRIEFLGRLDNQVKIRGFRVELEEIEAVLCEHPAALAAAVLVGGDPSGESRLNAYVVRAAGRSLAPEELREFLQAKLPEHMIPAAFVVRDDLPRTPQGKIDRRSLAAFEPLRPAGGQSYVAPRTPAEEKVAEMWSALLGIERVGADDNFFDLGGHSLLAMQLIARVQKAFRVELPVRALFNAPTVAGVAATIAQLLSAGAEASAPAITPVARESRRARWPELKENA